MSRRQRFGSGYFRNVVRIKCISDNG